MPLQDLSVGSTASRRSSSGLGSRTSEPTPEKTSWWDNFKSNFTSSGGDDSSMSNPEDPSDRLPVVDFGDDDDSSADIYDQPEFTYEPEVYAAITDAGTSNVFYTPDDILQEAYDADMAGKGEDKPDPLGNMGVPPATLKDVTGTEEGALSNPDPLYKMAEEVSTPTISTTVLDDEGNPVIDFDKITNIQDVRSDSALAGLTNPADISNAIAAALDEEVVDVSPAAEAADQVEPTETIEAVEPVQNVKFKFNLGSTQGKRERAVYDYAKDQGLSGTELNAFMAQVGHESGKYLNMRERGYSYSKNYAGFPQAWKDRLARDGVNAQNATAANIFNSVYANRNGNGDFASGDGNKYRGRGYIQLTGRKNYRDIGKDIGVDLEANPKLMEKPEIAMKASVAWWKRNVQDKVSDYSDVNAVSGLVNRGDATKTAKGLADRRSLYNHYSTQVQSGTSVRPRLRGLMSR